MLLVIPTAASAAPTVVSLTFDDGQQTQYQVRRILSSHGMHGTFFVNSALSAASTTSSFRMPWRRLEQLAADGNEIAGHTLNHVHLTKLTKAQQRTEICDDRRKLLDHGFFPVASFAYPYGEYNATSRSVAASCGYRSARKAGALRGGPNCSACPFAETIPPKEPFATRTVEAVGAATTLSSMRNSVRRAENNGGGWLQFVFHVICRSCSNSDAISPKKLDAFMDWLQPRAAKRTTVKTVAQVMGAGRAGFDPPRRPVGRKRQSSQTANTVMPTACWLPIGLGSDSFAWAPDRCRDGGLR